jgi:PhnB protein
MKTNYIPAGYHTATPYLIVNGAARAIDFYRQVFGATEEVRMDEPGGKVGHAEIRIGDSVIMLADEHPEINARGPQSIGGTPVSLLLYVPDCDAVVAKALSLGAKVLKPVQDQFYGDRSGTLADPFGHQWTIATHKEDVSPEEMQKRIAALYGGK